MEIEEDEKERIEMKEMDCEQMQQEESREIEGKKTVSKGLIIVMSCFFVVIFLLILLLFSLGIVFDNFRKTGPPPVFRTHLAIQPIEMEYNGTSFTCYQFVGNGSCWKEMSGIWTINIPKESSDEIIFVVRNNASFQITLRAYGQTTDYQMDGVPFLPSSPIASSRSSELSIHTKGDKRVFPNNKGTYLLHSSFAFQRYEGLSLPLLIQQDLPPSHTLAPMVNKAEEVVFMISQVCPKVEGQPSLDCSHQLVFNFLKNSSSSPFSLSSPLPSYLLTLVNLKTKENPSRVKVKKGAKVRLRIINGGSLNNFVVSFGGLNATVFASDGQLTLPFTTNEVWVGLGQRLDVLLEYETQGNFQVTATTANNQDTPTTVGMWIDVESLPDNSLTFSSLPNPRKMEFQTESFLRAFKNLPHKESDKVFVISLTGKFASFGVNGFSYQVYPFAPLPLAPNPRPLLVNFGDRVHIEFYSEDGCEHPVKNLFPLPFFHI